MFTPCRLLRRGAMQSLRQAVSLLWLAVLFFAGSIAQEIAVRSSAAPPPLRSNCTCEDVTAWVQPDAGAPLVVQVVNADYLRMQENFLVAVRNNTPVNENSIYLLCLDEESSTAMRDISGVRCVNVEGVDVVSTDKRSRQNVWKLRIRVASCLLEAGRDVLLSDNDAIWLKDPIEHLRHIDADILIQRDDWPMQPSGVAMCMGFAMLRSTGKGMSEFIKVFHELVEASGDDQVGMNLAVTKLGIEYDYDQTRSDMRNLESTGFGFGVVKDLPNNFTVALLPHSLYPRVCTDTPVTEETIVAHCFLRGLRTVKRREVKMRTMNLWYLD